MKKVIIAGFLSVALSGCVSDQAYRTYISKGTYPAKTISEVAVLYNKPGRDFVVLADLQARGDAVASFRKVAADLGADAIIVSKLGGYASDSTWAGSPDGASYSRIVGTVIKYK